MPTHTNTDCTQTHCCWFPGMVVPMSRGMLEIDQLQVCFLIAYDIFFIIYINPGVSYTLHLQHNKARSVNYLNE